MLIPTPNFSLNSIKCLTRVSRIWTIGARNYDIKWREEHRIPLNPTTYGPLTNKADYTYLDGRPTPLGSRQKQRVLKQRKMAKTIITLTKEIDFAKERYERNLKSREDERTKIIDGKLKPKGQNLLKKVV